MSDAASVVRETLAAALGAAPALEGVAICLAGAPEGLLPKIEVQDALAVDWSAKDWRGRELRTAIVLRVAEGQAGRLGPLREAVEVVGEAMGGEIGGGWRVASALFLRSRMVTESNGVRAVLIEHRVRVAQI